MYLIFRKIDNVLYRLDKEVMTRTAWKLAKIIKMSYH